jgi:polyphosphate glucokinase
MTRILCFDIGGSAIKAMVFDDSGKALTQKIRIPTPSPATPKAILAVMRSISETSVIGGKFERVSAGFPGVVKNGKTLNAPNLSPAWKNFPLQSTLEHEFGVDIRVANDADIQSLGASQGRGVELTITLGTGVGCGLVNNGILVPNLEMGHHPFRRGETYEEQLGRAAFDRIGKKRWNSRVQRMIRFLSIAFNFDHLYIGGGNAKHISGRLPTGVQLISNELGLAGGVKLWFPGIRVQSSLLKAA